MKFVLLILALFCSKFALTQTSDDSLLDAFSRNVIPITINVDNTNQESLFHWLGNEGIDVLFNFNSDSILEDMSPWLMAMVNFLLENEELKFEVGVHRDTRGGNFYSYDLTRSRANAIRDYFVEKGIAASRIEPIGYGASQPLISDTFIEGLENPQDKEIAHARNRRVTFRFK